MTTASNAEIIRNGATTMTREEFDTRFAATQNNTEGYTDEELDEINDAVFAEVADMDADDDIAVNHVKNMFAREMNARD